MAEAKSTDNKEPLVSEAHSTLFHYTTEAGLYGILESQQLWATHFAYLNDSQEIVAAKSALVQSLYDPLYKMAKKLIVEKKMNLNNEITVEELCLQEARRVVELFYKVTLNNVTPYIFSFCSHDLNNREYHDGLLSQWRGYGSDGGFAIEFGSEALEKLLDKDGTTCSHSGFHLSSVVYGVDTQDFMYLKDGLHVIASVATQMMSVFLGLGGGEPDINSTFLPFVQCITRMKHPGFSEEREVRLVYIKPEDDAVPKDKPSRKEIRFRQRSGLLIPYVRVFSEIDETLPVKRVIVGPHPKANLRKKSLQLFLSQREIDIEVEISSIPYLPE